MIYCFDLDGVLVTETKTGDYSDSQPIPDAISKLREFYDDHTIIIHTARSYDWLGHTQKQLSEFDIPHDLLVMAKPKADYYIDDRAINSEDWLAG